MLRAGLPQATVDTAQTRLLLVAEIGGGDLLPNATVLATVLETLGVHLGEVDVRVHGSACGGAVLAG
ncbi:MAG: hypothetical protein APF80_00765 [Alphaproteobacteria bacterium BRH_c36]|nr:MAG: hypothetical protein APF80_00765 [Alphaproteobacteria bacterium BRH_c36]